MFFNIIGEVKVDVIVLRIYLINFVCKVNCIEDFVILENMVMFLIKEMYVVVDVIDSICVKVVMIVYCKCNKIFIVMVGGVGG